MQNNLPSEVNKLLRSWNNQIKKNEKSHRRKALFFRKMYYLLGAPATVISGLTTTGSFVTFQECDLMALCAFQAFGSAAVTILVAVQTYLQLMSRYFENKIASDRYQALSRTIETILITPSDSPPAAVISSIRQIFDDIVNTSPISSADIQNLEYISFDRETRSRPQSPVKPEVEKPNLLQKLRKTISSDADDTALPPSPPQMKMASIVTNSQDPATKEELEEVNAYDTDEEKVCIDMEIPKSYPIDPALQYQMDRFYSDSNSLKK